MYVTFYTVFCAFIGILINLVIYLSLICAVLVLHTDVTVVLIYTQIPPELFGISTRTEILFEQSLNQTIQIC